MNRRMPPTNKAFRVAVLCVLVSGHRRFGVTCHTENGATGFPEALDQIYWTTRRHILGDSNLDPRHRVNIKSHLSVAVLEDFHVWLNLSIFNSWRWIPLVFTDRRRASKSLPRILWHPKFRNSQALIPLLNHINPPAVLYKTSAVTTSWVTISTKHQPWETSNSSNSQNISLFL